MNKISLVRAKLKDAEEILALEKQAGSSKQSLNNKLVKSAKSSAVFLVVNGQKLPFSSAAAFFRAGYSFSKVKIISDIELNSLPDHGENYREFRETSFSKISLKPKSWTRSGK